MQSCNSACSWSYRHPPLRGWETGEIRAGPSQVCWIGNTCLSTKHPDTQAETHPLNVETCNTMIQNLSSRLLNEHTFLLITRILQYAACLEHAEVDFLSKQHFPDSLLWEHTFHTLLQLWRRCRAPQLGRENRKRKVEIYVSYKMGTANVEESAQVKSDQNWTCKPTCNCVVEN